MKYKRLLIPLLVLCPLSCFSQIDATHLMHISQNAIENVRRKSIGTADSTSVTSERIEYRQIYNPVIDPLFAYRIARPLELYAPELHFTPGEARLFRWSGGSIVASGGTRSMPGMMQIDNGALGIYQSVGSFTFYAGGMANKYGYFNGLHTQYGLNGSITYQFMPSLSATVFGDYYYGRPPKMANGMPMPLSMMGYYGRSTFGGYIDYLINDHWGVQIGVQTVQQVGTNRYQPEPIVTPYYRINKKVAIGLPVGQILYQIINDNVRRRHH